MQAMNNRRTRRLPRDFRRLPHPGMDPDAELIAEHRRLSAVVDVASLLGRETIGTRTVDNWTVKPSTETGPRRLGAWLHGDQCPERGELLERCRP